MQIKGKTPKIYPLDPKFPARFPMGGLFNEESDTYFTTHLSTLKAQIQHFILSQNGNE